MLAFVSVGPLEIAVLAIIALIVLGPKRLPDAARSLGRGMREMRTALQGGGDDDDHRSHHHDDDDFDEDHDLDEDRDLDEGHSAEEDESDDASGHEHERVQG